MCSFILWHRVFGGYPVVVAANRDEDISRPSSPPFVWEGSPPVLAPRDDRRGGTWIGANTRPLLIGLTNRHAIPSHPGMKSRGHLPINGLELASAQEVADWMSGLDASEYNGIHLVAADPIEAFLCVGDGAEGGKAFRIERLLPGMHVVTNFGLGVEHPRGDRIRSMVRDHRLMDGPPRPSAFKPLLEMHESDIHPWGGPGGPSATCIHRPSEDDYGTKSSCVIRLNPGLDGQGRRWQWWNRERPSDHEGACTVPLREIDPLPIDPRARLFLGDEEAPE